MTTGTVEAKDPSVVGGGSKASPYQPPTTGGFNSSRRRKLVNGMLRCGRCKEWLHPNCFPRDKYKWDGISNKCRSCHSKTRSKRRIQDKVRYPKETKARQDLRIALRKGLIKKPAKCEMCGVESSKLHGHHEDYSKPLDVNWLCFDCHSVVHNPLSTPLDGVLFTPKLVPKTVLVHR